MRLLQKLLPSDFQICGIYEFSLDTFATVYQFKGLCSLRGLRNFSRNFQHGLSFSRFTGLTRFLQKVHMIHGFSRNFRHDQSISRFTRFAESTRFIYFLHGQLRDYEILGVYDVCLETFTMAPLYRSLRRLRGFLETFPRQISRFTKLTGLHRN